jgi:hypothetical protein
MFSIDGRRRRDLSLTATPITYTINFTTTGGVAPTSGSFTYDAAAAIGSHFTNLDVVWGGEIFDLTFAANEPYLEGDLPGCSQGPYNSASSFTLLGGSLCTPTNVTTWDIQANQPMAIVTFLDGVTAEFSDALFQDFTTTIAFTSGHGTFSITAAPEPSTMGLVGVGGAWLVWKRRQRARQEARSR